MATSNLPNPYTGGDGNRSGSSAGNFFSSRKNIVGMVLAVLVIVMHVAFGLGFLWPVAAVAAWGAGVALTPEPGRKMIMPPPQPAEPANKILKQDMKAVLRDLRQARPPEAVTQQADELEANLDFVLDEWDDLQSSPEHQQTVWNIIKIYLPEVVTTYLNAPQFQDHSAAAVMQDSLSTLTSATARIKQGILDHSLRAMDSHARTLRETFGNLPGLDQQ